MHERMDDTGCLLAHARGNGINRCNVRQVRAQPCCVCERACTLARLAFLAIDEKDTRACSRKCRGNGLANLYPFAPDTCEHDVSRCKLHFLPPPRDIPAPDWASRGMKYVMRGTQMRKMLRVKRVGVVLGVLFVLMLALTGVQSITRGTPVRSVVSFGKGGGLPALTDSLFERSVQLYTGLELSRGNQVEFVNNGSVYTRLWADLRAAKQTITVQMYFSMPGAVADTLAAILKDRARHGVRVLFVLDAFGSQKLKLSWADSLRASGVEVALLRQLHWYTLHNASDRSHVRVVVVDGAIAYTGGFGLADYWLGDGRHPDQWRDSNVRFTGPAVMALQAAFAAAWAESTGELITGGSFFPEASFVSKGGPVLGGLLFSAPTTGSTPAERFNALSIASARKTLYVTNSYFVPDDDFRFLLKESRRRGVDVRILTVSSNSDVKTTWWAGRSRYERTAPRRHPDLRVPALDDACQDVHCRRPVGHRRLDELRQPFTRLQRRVEFRVPRPNAWRRDGLDVLRRPHAQQGDPACRVRESPVV